MKKLINLLTIFIFMISPMVVNAQTQDEKWVSLGEFLQDKYVDQKNYLVPRYTNVFQYVTKLAYKQPESNVVLPESEIIINKLNHVDNNGIPVFEKEEPFIVNQLFEITQNGKQPVEYNLTEEENGWKIIDLKGVGSITSILVRKKSKTNNNDIFDHIYVTLDETQDPYKIKEERLKTIEEKKLRAEKLRNSSFQSSLPEVQ